jgi:hypothetical protein
LSAAVWPRSTFVMIVKMPVPFLRLPKAGQRINNTTTFNRPVCRLHKHYKTPHKEASLSFVPGRRDTASTGVLAMSRRVPAEQQDSTNVAKGGKSRNSSAM